MNSHVDAIFIRLYSIQEPKFSQSSSVVHPYVFHSFVSGAPTFSSSFLCRWTRFDGFLPALAFACPGTHTDSLCLLPLRCISCASILLLILEACEVRCSQYFAVSDLTQYCDDRGLWCPMLGCSCGVHCGMSSKGDAGMCAAAMADTVRERVAAEEHMADRNFNAGVSDVLDCSKPLVFDSSKLIPCETPKVQDMAAMRSCIATADSIGMKTLQHIVESLETRLQSALMQILETLGKDAAARVVMAERKASVMEQEHINAKQQALAMMLRIKHSSDSMLVDAERRLLLEKRRSQELEYKVGSLQETIRKMKAELKKKGDILEELQRTHLDAGIRSGLMSPSEGVSKKRKGNPQVRLMEVKISQPGDGLVEDECDDTATLLATMPTRSPSTDRPNSVLGRGLVPSTPQNSAVQDYTRAAPTNNKQGSLRRHLDDGSAVKFPSHRDKELNLSASCTAEQKKILAESKSTRAKPADVDEESSDEHDSSLEGPSHNAEKKSQFKRDSLVNGEDMEGMDDGFLGLIALQGASSIPLATKELQNGDRVPGLKSGAEAKDVGDSSTDDEEEYQSKQKKTARGVRSSDEGNIRRNKIPDTSKSSLVEQTMVLRRSSVGRKRGKQHVSPEKSDGPVLNEKQVKASGAIEVAEISALPKLKGGAVDAVDGSSSLVVESSRDSRRLMQGARQLLSLRKL